MLTLRFIILPLALFSLFSCNNNDSEHRSFKSQDQYSVTRQWNEALLHSIRNDFARPTVHARNLFHTSILAHDIWAMTTGQASAYSLGSPINCSITDTQSNNVSADTAIAHAQYALLTHRFQHSPNAQVLLPHYSNLLNEQIRSGIVSSDEHSAQLGVMLASCLIDFGLSDGSNEQNNYANQFYRSSNPPLKPEHFGNPNIIDLNIWQPLSLINSIDQSGNNTDKQPEFLGAEWGNVTPFSISASGSHVINQKNFNVFLDPGAPPLVDDENHLYAWGFALVSAWSSHLDPANTAMIDISPASLGNLPDYPINTADYKDFYDIEQGGDSSRGYSSNPHTGQAYPKQVVKRADYARVLAEFWADGPDSETPPGHWFVILNSVSDHPLFNFKQSAIQAETKMEWEVKSYFSLGAAMHDAAITAWSIKSKYNYIRPISAIRALAELGQYSNESADNFHPNGLPLIEGFIETIEVGDPLAGNNERHVGNIKLKAWQGGGLNISDSSAGVGWILAGNWWPYQRLSFVTPPFAGYISGHSTFSSAAAQVLSSLTGDPFFPGGKSEYTIEKDSFLAFEQGPSQALTLEWATYKDAADQCSLSRIWGGIHPPVDDIPGRIIGLKIGKESFLKAASYWQ